MLIRGPKVALRRAVPADGTRAYEWLAQSDLTPLMLGAPLYPELPVPARASFDARYPPYLFEGGHPFDGRALIIAAGDEDIGVLIYGAVRLPAGAVEMELWLAEKRRCGHGYGSEALQLACAWLQAELGVDTFVLRPTRRNLRALRALRRAGFRAATADRESLQRQLDLPRHAAADSELMLLALPSPPARLSPQAQAHCVFIDSEFTDLQQPQLISFGAVAADGAAFYRELDGWDPQAGSEFVRRVVVPLLDGRAVAPAQAAREFVEWLEQRARQEPLTLVSDSAYDRWALAELFGGESLPAGLHWQRVALPYERLDAVTARLQLRRHHALDDARGLRAALLRNPTAGGSTGR